MVAVAEDVFDNEEELIKKINLKKITKKEKSEVKFDNLFELFSKIISIELNSTGDKPQTKPIISEQVNQSSTNDESRQ